jgi:hypothetical protein
MVWVRAFICAESPVMGSQQADHWYWYDRERVFDIGV